MIGIRGATTIDRDTSEEIEKATVELMKEIMLRNDLKKEKIVSVLFSATEDVRSAYPGRFLRDAMDFSDVAILHFQEMYVTESLNLCIRVLIHYDDCFKPHHVYLHAAKKLRPDLGS
ncbi:chorismate mutase [Proteiniclasticum sp.]|uniref:chorismate mutase n=1 Tax=Proteiniclasticum sp. TaxID=2053595 RepID=UPI00289ADECB|nr:chorismate mutase [Proteiniclasticum sp.]